MVSIMHEIEALESDIDEKVKHKMALLCAVYGITCNPRLNVGCFEIAVKKVLKTGKAYISRILLMQVERLKLQRWMLLHYSKRRDTISLKKLLKELDHEISCLKKKQLTKS